MSKRKKFGFSWSWKRALGLSGLKNRISRQIGIPLTRSGRQRKVGRMLGCLLPLATLLLSCAAVWAIGCGAVVNRPG